MSNYKDYLISAGGGGGLTPGWEQTWNLVDTASGYIYSSSHIQQSSTTYQSFHRLATAGLYGGIFDPYNSSNQGYVVAKAFSVNQSTGAITVHSGSNIWNHSYGQTFSTCHHGAVGHTVMNVGHHRNPSYGSTNKGWVFGAEFTTSGSVEQTGNAAAPIEAWPHSNGDLVMGTNATKDGTVRARRSTYNSSNGAYYHSRNTFSNGSVSYDEWTNLSSATSTNYAYPFCRQSYDDLTPGGYIGYQTSTSNVNRFSICYGSSCDRGTEYDPSTYFGSSSIPSYMTGYHLSTGEYLVIHNSNGKWARFNSSGSVVAGSYNNDTLEGAGLLGSLNHRDTIGKMSIPLSNNDEWLVPTQYSEGWIRIKIDVNNNYKASILGQYGSLLGGQGLNPTHSGHTYDVTGSSSQYFVHAYVSGGSYTINVYDNPTVFQ